MHKNGSNLIQISPPLFLGALVPCGGDGGGGRLLVEISIGLGGGGGGGIVILFILGE